MIRLLLLLPLLSTLIGDQATYPTPGPGRQVHACTPPTMTYRWTPTSGCSTSTPCATDQVAGNNASQTTSGDLPTYGATCGPNSTPCLTFNGTSDFLTPTTPIASSGLTAVTVYAVVNMTSTSVLNYIYGGANFGFTFRTNTDGTVGFGVEGIVGSDGTQVLSPSTWYTIVVTYDNGTTTTNFYNATGGGLAPEGTSGTALSWSAATPTMASDTPNFSSFFGGSIAEWGYTNSVNTSGIANWSSCHYGV